MDEAEEHAGNTNLETLVWLADAFAHTFEEDEPGLRPYLSAVTDEALFEEELSPRLLSTGASRPT